jgi:hypothetical protein
MFNGSNPGLSKGARNGDGLQSTRHLAAARPRFFAKGGRAGRPHHPCDRPSRLGRAFQRRRPGRAGYFKAGTAPASILIQVTGLVIPELLIELVPVAVVSPDRYRAPRALGEG